MLYPNYRAQEYRQQDVMGASPVHLVVMAYDVAILACEQKNFEKAVRAVTVLRDALNFDYADVATGLFRIYQWCLDCIRQEDYASAAKTLRELREAWAEVEKRMTAAPVPVRNAVPAACV
ncbi:MAG: flagellar protein FliS [Chloroflexi bacterium]|jgi:flagellin-specific chaperone FliS|nr:flagellar protein FliS [Chloroflexota bacterium]